MTGFLLAAFLSLQTADVATSCYGFGHGYQETNPFAARSCGLLTGEVAAIDTAGLWVVNGHVRTPWKRALIYGAVAALEAKAVTHNLRTFQRGQR